MRANPHGKGRPVRIIARIFHEKFCEGDEAVRTRGILARRADQWRIFGLGSRGAPSARQQEGSRESANGLGRHTAAVEGPSERVDRKTALWMKTRWAAQYTSEENKLGSIEPDKFADFLVLGGDYMAVPEEQISDLPILMTVVGGKVRFEDPGKL